MNELYFGNRLNNRTSFHSFRFRCLERAHVQYHITVAELQGKKDRSSHNLEAFENIRQGKSASLDRLLNFWSPKGTSSIWVTVVEGLTALMRHGIGNDKLGRMVFRFWWLWTHVLLHFNSEQGNFYLNYSLNLAMILMKLEASLWWFTAYNWSI